VGATCHYCDRAATFSVMLRTRATEQPTDQRQRVCEVHDAIVSSLTSVSILERRTWHALPPSETIGTVITIGSDRSTIVQRPAHRGRLRSLLGR